MVEGYNHRRVGFILDCCYAGAAVTDLRGTTEDEVKAVTAGKQVFVLCGSSSIQTAKELDVLGHGVLTAGILRGIESGAADRDDDGIITLNDLFQFCSEFSSRHSHQEPVCANRLTGVELPIHESASGSHNRKSMRSGSGLRSSRRTTSWTKS